ncbi:restriction endonuclease subunit S [Lachnoanaerobaculum saburreum]|uniref:Type I restriction modification DNA specificity domain protein n=1 Tax=Lachnoanaerobaculum saburreum TaxID=467210 RepID=A0A133ZXK9_9FIRM|nr:restriction endonuclease subunit S [Lachnoanaerobaculum saburreum]KXB60175.1 type I restriction modification DNA specificity domain protein [Lachnoanaerobaculum saburreum]
MEYRTLKDIAKITMGQSPDSSSYNKEKDGLPFFQGNADFGELYPNERIWCNEPKKVAIPGDILISVRAPIGALNYAKEKSCIGRGLAAITIKNVVERNYIFHLLRARNKYLNSKGTGSTFKAIGKNVLEEVLVPQISREEQQKCVNVIDLIESIIIERKSQIDKLDELVRARFVEMFGDVIHNDKLWEKHTVESLCKEIYGGGTPSKSHPEYYENGDIPWVSSKDMKSDVVTDSQIKINRLGLDNSTAKMVPINSVIMVIRSGILKHTLPVAINAVPITVNQDLKVFIPGEHVLTRFLAVQFKMHEKDILSGVRAVTADNIEFDSLKQRELIVPPIELQHEYVFFLEQIDKSKVEVQKALDKAQLLFDSLMQKYFG